LRSWEQKKYEEAAGYLKAALRLKRDAADTSYALAVCYKALGIDDGYRDTLLYTLTFDPKMPEANYDYGQLLLEDGDTAGAAEHFRLSADAAPTQDKPLDALMKLGSASKRLSEAQTLKSTDPAKALVEARIAAALDPESVTAALLVAELYEANKLPDEAREAYGAVLRIDPGNETATDALKRMGNGS